jgi:hypothetical protein
MQANPNRGTGHTLSPRQHAFGLLVDSLEEALRVDGLTTAERAALADVLWKATPLAFASSDASERADVVTVTLTPAMAKLVADDLLRDLGGAIEDRGGAPLSRDEIDEILALIHGCIAAMDRLAWGDPAGPVDVVLDRRTLEDLAAGFFEAGGERIARPDGYAMDGSSSPEIRREGMDYVATAQAITDALAA